MRRLGGAASNTDTTSVSSLMPNIASLLKSEISRIARKEIKAEITALRKAATTHRSEIAALKRRVQSLEQQVKRVGRVTSRPAAAPDEDDSAASGLRFSAKGLKSLRQRLGLSAAECGLLVGASDQSIYKWEEGKVRPRARHLPAIAALRGLGKKEAAAKLESLRETA
jgi:DNA-binding transcriptional regulator YiaG